MAEKFEHLDFLINIAFMLTYKCFIACPHCIFESGPARTEQMRFEDVSNWLTQAAAFRDGHIGGLALTGGEPFASIDLLEKISQWGAKLGFAQSVVTNAYWAQSYSKALRMLKRFRAIKLIALSTDEYHQKFIPVENIENAVRAANDLGRIHSISVCTDNYDNPVYKSIIERLLQFTEADHIRTTITFPVGRAARRIDDYKYRMSTEPTISVCSMASSPVVFPDGHVSGCIGPVAVKLTTNHPMAWGNLNENSLAEILNRAECDPVFHALRIWGPHKLVAMLKDAGKSAWLPKEYVSGSICDICYRLFKDERILGFLDDLRSDNEFTEKVAYGRLYYLNEPRMLEMLGVV